MSIPQFDNPLERLSVLPNAMNWRDTWVSGTQYFMNDVVTEPNSTVTYILVGVTSLLSTENPATDPLWTVLSATTTGVTGVQQGAGISITGSSTNPTISNAGIISILPGVNINIDDVDPQNPIINCTAVQEIIGGVGITVAGLPNPIVTNTGVRTLTVGAGLSSSGGPHPGLANTGVVSIEAGDGIEVLGLPNPIITNTGVFSIIAGENCTISPLNGKGDVTVNALAPQLTRAWTFINTAAGITTDPFPIPAADTVTGTSGTGTFLLGFNLVDDSIFKTYLADGAPDPNGVFLIDMTAYNLLYIGNGDSGLNDIDGVPPYALTFQLRDTTTAGGPYSYTLTSFAANISNSGPNGVKYPFPVTLGQFYFDVNFARGAGMRTIDEIIIVNNLTSPLELITGNNVYAVYYPRGPE